MLKSVFIPTANAEETQQMLDRISTGEIVELNKVQWDALYSVASVPADQLSTGRIPIMDTLSSSISGTYGTSFTMKANELLDEAEVAMYTMFIYDNRLWIRVGSTTAVTFTDRGFCKQQNFRAETKYLCASPIGITVDQIQPLNMVDVMSYLKIFIRN